MACVCLQEKIVTAAALCRDESSPAIISERIREIVFNAMTQSAVFEVIDSVNKPFGGLKKNVGCALNVASLFRGLWYLLLLAPI